MPKHYAIGANSISGTVHFQNAKVALITFVDDAGNPVTFTKRPRVTLTVLDSTNNPPYKIKDRKSGADFTGITVGFQNPVTLDVEWHAMER